MPEWRKNDMQGEVIEMQQRKQGIWWNCMFYSTGQWHCDDFDRFFIGLPAELQTARALMIIACLMGFLGYVMSNFGLSCSSFMTDESGNPTDAKNKVAITGAVCFGICALCTGVAVSYYAAVVVQDFYMAGGMTGQGLGNAGGIASTAGGNRYIYGTALFIGWFGLIMGLLGMVLQIVGTTSNNDEDSDWNQNAYPNAGTYNNPAFAPKQTRPGTEFI